MSNFWTVTAFCVPTVAASLFAVFIEKVKRKVLMQDASVAEIASKKLTQVMWLLKYNLICQSI